ncbi:MAG: LamG domain-containing protein [Sediminibacterium sp.]|nr:LamG domain-containing protein [Sediminibacterium sp.]
MRFFYINLLAFFMLFFGIYSHAQNNQINGITNTSFRTNTYEPGANVDHIQLPPLYLTDSFTIETWFKSDFYIRYNGYYYIYVFDFRQNQNQTFIGTDNGITLKFIGFFGAVNPELFLSVNGASLVKSFENNSIAFANGWNHYAVTYDGATIKLYINGVLYKIEPLNNSLDSNACLSNFIGRSNVPSNNSTLGQYKDFRIWKTARSAAEILNNYRAPLNLPADSNNLYYYLPLTKSNIYESKNIESGNTLVNTSTWSNKNSLSSTVISKNNNSAIYYFDSNYQQLYGILRANALKNSLKPV